LKRWRKKGIILGVKKTGKKQKRNVIMGVTQTPGGGSCPDRKSNVCREKKFKP